MQQPFWKSASKDKKELQEVFGSVAEACITAGIGIIVVPLVDNGRIDQGDQEKVLFDYLRENADDWGSKGLRIIFESDYPPAELAAFMERLGKGPFGVNYDTGNSAALGYSVKEEFEAYAGHIVNVHIKDRVLGGTTVPLGEGAVCFDAVFAALGEHGYEGNLILQTARAEDERHRETLMRYRDMVLEWMN